MSKLFRNPPAGRLTLPRLPDLAQRLLELERRVEVLERLAGEDAAKNL
jgi:hypothetical protein